MAASTSSFTVEQAERFFPTIVKNLPKEWTGTTFRNTELLGREEFANRLANLIAAKDAAGDHSISADELLAIGNAEDYLRVASNVSTSLELLLAVRKGLTVSSVFSFSSTRMPIVAVSLTSTAPVHLYAKAAASTYGELADLLKLLGRTVVLHEGKAQAHADGVVLAIDDSETDAWADSNGVDGVVGPSVLYIRRPESIVASEILVIRKRLAIPMTTPAALDLITGGDANSGAPGSEALTGFLHHLQQLCGTPTDDGALPVVCTAGLSALASFYTALVLRGGADVLMCATAYGGSSQLSDITASRSPALFKKHTFEAAGQVNINETIASKLGELGGRAAELLMPLLVLFVEVPTNPDMKVPDLAALVAEAAAYKSKTGREVLFVVDTTFGPNSQVLAKLRALDDQLPAFVFISMSKSVSRGHTVSGAFIANHTATATDVLSTVRHTAALLDNTARPDQLAVLAREHVGVEDRCQRAYLVAREAGDVLRQAVHDRCDGFDMPLQFVTPETAAVGFTTPTFSFNLPSPKDATTEVNAALAQQFVDLLTAHSEHFKPCVSFGQDNGLVYATVPATSTQGAIKEEDKAKQAVGGVQLVRLSFPPTLDAPTVQKILRESVAALYP